MKIHVCDICRTNEPDVRIKYKAERRAHESTRFFPIMFDYEDWERIEICDLCLSRIIDAKKEGGEGMIEFLSEHWVLVFGLTEFVLGYIFGVSQRKERE